MLEKASLELAPFPHCIILNAINNYDDLVKSRPPVPGVGNNKRFDIPARVLLDMDIDPFLRAFIEYHTSKAFYQEVDDLFELGLKGNVGVRGRDKTPIQMDCQISINTPVSEPSQVCIAHIDNPITKWAGLLYMKDPDDTAGGDLELYDCPEPEFFGKRRVANPGKPAKVVKYEANTFIGFKNQRTAVHAPTVRAKTEKTRKFINFVIDGG